jgi:hypothetical protein
VCCWLLCEPKLAAQDTFESAPIEYSKSVPDNPVSRLQQRIESGEVVLPRDDAQGYLAAVLRELHVPQESQTLVFSKTSMQIQRITPRTPRAIYFNDDVYVGFCQGGDVLEVSTADAALGTVFYTVNQKPADETKLVRFERQTEHCLVCHSSSRTEGVPGHVVRSLFVGASGHPLLGAGSRVVDHTTPVKDRWGGWYVTGQHGSQTHQGNLIVRNEDEAESADNAAGQNVTDLSSRFSVDRYLTPHSDIVALMVLEHQAEAHNLITRANFLTRQAVHHQQMLNRELGEPADRVWDSTKSRIKSANEPLVEYLLFSGEAELTHRVVGTSGFAEEFAARGPHDPQGRSLREFDLARRLFKYPCSYLIYSPSFEALPSESKEYVFRRMDEVLGGVDATNKFGHLTASDRRAIREILEATLPAWREYQSGAFTQPAAAPAAAAKN